MMKYLLALTVLFASLEHVKAGTVKIDVNLDPFFLLPEAYKKKNSDLIKIFPKSRGLSPFQWLTKDKSRAIFKRHARRGVEFNLTLLDGQVPIEEYIIDFREGAFLGATASVYNRGDGGKISATDFSNRFTTLGKHLGKQLATRPRARKGNIRKGVMTHGYSWSSLRGMAVLLTNPDVGDPQSPQKMEFMRLRLARKDAKGLYKAALQERSGATVRKSRLSGNVVKKDGNVYIKNIPMVDQGNKGYCVVASAQRLFEYYGISCDMHQLAQLAKSDPNRGTSSLYINEQLGKIDYRFKTRFACLAISHNGGLVELKDNKYVGDKVSRRRYDKYLKTNIDKGIPLLWSLELGLKPEYPPISPQARGGHMRMIIGYNEKENKIIFSDSWGAGHEFKTMNADDAYKVTRGLYLMTPTVN